VTPDPSNRGENRFSLLKNDLLEKQSGRLFAQYLSSYQSPLLDQLLEDPSRVFLEPGAEILKDDTKTAVARTSFDGRSIVVKHYPVKNAWHRIRLVFKASRAQNNFQYAQTLSQVGIRALRPVAWIQERRFGVRAQSWLVYEHIDDSICADTLTDDSDPKTVDRVMQTVAHNLRIMRESLLSHGDMKPSNVLITANEVVLIDLDAMQAYPDASRCEKGLAKDVARWMRWWRSDRPQPAIADKAQTALKTAGFEVLSP
jgi:RIO-like serine/threonine protein kinase